MNNKNKLLAILFSVWFTGGHLFAQAPTDEWRRGGMDAMVAEPGQASSILSNPAGIKNKEERHSLLQDKNKAGKKHEWITEVVSADAFLTADTWELLQDPSKISDRIIDEFKFVTNLTKLLSEDPTGDDKTVELIKSLTDKAYDRLVNDIDSLQGKDNLTIQKIKDLSRDDKEKLVDNLKDAADVVSELTDVMIDKISKSVGDLGLELYARTLSLSHVNDYKPLAWGFYFGIEEKAVFRNNVKSVSMPLSMTIKGIKLKANVPLGLQVYFTTPLRLAFAHDFNEALPGFTFGLGLKFAPYIGMNQNSLGNLISNSANDSGVDANKVLSDALTSLVGVNLGLDFGVQYHFGAIMPQLKFLHAGLKISDLLGFNIPFSSKGDKVRYAIDFDWGVYAEHQFPKILQVFGGLEIIQLRGLFKGGQSPYSALFDPIDHLRLLAGVGLFNNALRVTLQYYNSNFSPGLMLNLGSFQFQAAIHLNTVAKDFWGAELALRFRSPHNGFNKRTPYKTYDQLAQERGATEDDNAPAGEAN